MSKKESSAARRTAQAAQRVRDAVDAYIEAVAGPQTPPDNSTAKSITTDNGGAYVSAVKDCGARARLEQLGLKISQARLALEGLIAHHDGLNIDKRLSGAVGELLSAIDRECDEIERMQARSGDSLLGIVPGLLELTLAEHTDGEWAFKAGNYLAILNHAAFDITPNDPKRAEIAALWRRYMEKRGVDFSEDGVPRRVDGVREAFGG